MKSAKCCSPPRKCKTNHTEILSEGHGGKKDALAHSTRGQNTVNFINFGDKCLDFFYTVIDSSRLSMLVYSVAGFMM